MKEITGINHIGLRVRDLASAKSFYEQLGFIFIAGPLGPEPVAIMEHPSSVNINFILNASSSNPKNILMDIPEKHPGYTHVALEVSDVKSVQRQLVSKGIKLLRDQYHFPMAHQFLFVIKTKMLLNFMSRQNESSKS